MTTLMGSTGPAQVNGHEPDDPAQWAAQAQEPAPEPKGESVVPVAAPRAAWKVEAVGCVILTVVGLASAVAATTLNDRHAQVPVFRTLAVVVLAFIPGWLYIRFTTYRAAAVWDEYVLNLHRLQVDDPGNLPEPLMNSTYHRAWADQGGERSCDSPNIYSEKFEAYYGKGTARTRSAEPPDLHSRVDTLFPICSPP